MKTHSGNLKSLILKLILLLFGGISFFRLNFGIYPDFSFPGLTVETRFVGMDAYGIEEILTVPVEDSVSRVSGIKELFSTSEEGVSRVHVLFHRGSDLYLKSSEIKEAIEPLLASFPGEAEKPVVLKYESGNDPAFILQVAKKGLSIEKTAETAEEKIKPELESLEGISSVFVSGKSLEEIVILPDPLKLQQSGVTIDRIASSLQGENVSFTAGEISDKGKLFKLSVREKFTGISRVGSVNVSGVLNKPVLLKDVAEIKKRYRDKETLSLSDGKETVTLYIYASNGDTFQTGKEIERLKSSYEKQGWEIHYKKDSSKEIKVFLLKRSLILILLISLCSLFLYYNSASWNILYGFWILVLLLGSVFFIGHFLFQFTLDRISFNLLFVYIGAAFYSMFQKDRSFVIFLFILPLSVLVLNLYEYEINFKYIVLLISGNLTLFFFKEKNFITINSDRMLNLTQLIPKKRSKIIFIKLNFFYAKWGTGLFVLTLVLLVCFVSFYDFSSGKDSARSDLELKLEFPNGFSLKKAELITIKTDSWLRKEPGLQKITAKIAKDQSEFHIDSPGFLSAEKLESEIEKWNESIKPAFLHIPSKTRFSDKKTIIIDVKGKEIEKIMDTIIRLQKEISSSGIESRVLNHFKTPGESLEINIDSHKSAVSNLDASSILNTVYPALQGRVASHYYENGRERDITIHIARELVNTEENLENYPIAVNAEKAVSLGQLGEFKKVKTLNRIFRSNKRRTLSFEAAVNAGGVYDLENLVKKFSQGISECDVEIREENGKEKKENLLKLIKLLVLYYLWTAAFFESFTKGNFVFINSVLLLSPVFFFLVIL